MTAVEFKGAPQDLVDFLTGLIGGGAAIVSVTKTKSAGSYLVVSI